VADNVQTPIQAVDANAAVVNIGSAQPAGAAPDATSANSAQAALGTNRSQAFQDLANRVKGLPLAQKAILGGGALFFLLVVLFTSFSGTKDEFFSPMWMRKIQRQSLPLYNKWVFRTSLRKAAAPSWSPPRQSMKLA
jgi:hypothetical protein